MQPGLIGLAQTPQAFTTIAPSATSSTTFQGTLFVGSLFEFFSSTGNCKAYEFKKHKELDFLTNNLTALRSESAQGNGEVLDAFACMLECSSEGTINLKNYLQINWQKIYMNNNDFSDANYVYEQLKDNFSEKNSKINNCKNGFSN